MAQSPNTSHFLSSSIISYLQFMQLFRRAGFFAKFITQLIRSPTQEFPFAWTSKHIISSAALSASASHIHSIHTHHHHQSTLFAIHFFSFSHIPGYTNPSSPSALSSLYNVLRHIRTPHHWTDTHPPTALSVDVDFLSRFETETITFFFMITDQFFYLTYRFLHVEHRIARIIPSSCMI